MRFLQFFVFFITLFSSTLSALTLQDDFESGSKNGWTTSGTTIVDEGAPINSHVLRINNENEWTVVVPLITFM